MSPCTYCGRPAWQATGGMGGGIMPDDETHCLKRLGRSCRIAHEGYMAGLRLAYIGAACAEVMWDAKARFYDRKPNYDQELRDRYDFAALNAWEVAHAIRDALCTLGDEAAIAIRKETP